MGKYEGNTPVNKATKSNRKPASNNKKKIVLIVILSVILAVLLMFFVVPQLLFRLRGDVENPDFDEAGQTEAIAESVPEASYDPADTLVFPLALEDGKLEIESFFPYSGMNPDGGFEDVTDTAAIILNNTSDQYLDQAVITAILQDGTQCIFRIHGIPAGKSVTTFATGNEVFATNGFCAELSCEASFIAEETWDQLDVFVEGLTVTLQNNSDNDLANIDVYCRDTFGDSYFSGIAYKYTIDELPAGQHATVNVTDSVLGMIEVVRIAINES